MGEIFAVKHLIIEEIVMCDRCDRAEAEFDRAVVEFDKAVVECLGK